jgi:hypothetical protein
MTPATGKPPMAAMLSTVGAVVLAIVGYQLLNRAADTGLERLDRIDRVRAMCDAYYAQARSRADTMRIDRLALPDTIDPKSKDAIDRCGDLRAASSMNTIPNPREMGEEIPRGLR